MTSRPVRPARPAGAAPVHGYGDKSLAHKLGLLANPGWRVLSVDAPAQYAELLADVWPLASHTTRRGRQQLFGDFDLVHLFVADERTLADRVPSAVDCLADGASLWVSWPKKGSALFKGLTEDGVRKAVLPTGLVDVKVAAVDATWSGLKFLRRRA